MELAQILEHTLLKPNVTADEIKQLCVDAIAHSFVAVCVPPYYVALAARKLDDTPIKVVTVVGFPMGYEATQVKVEQVKQSIEQGVDEVDMVVNIAAIKDGNWSYVSNDIRSVTMAAHIKGKQIKVIFETGILTQEEILRLCDICNDIKVDYVKTSTGINASGVTLDTILCLRDNLNGIKLKASGGIKTKAFAEQLMKAGVSRIGTSAALAIINE